MIRASVSHTKNHLSALLSEVKRGESVLITDRDKPIAQIVPVESYALDERIREMAAQGLVRLPLSPRRPVEEIRPIRLTGNQDPNVLEALLEERREGR